ncbi:HTH-type transcriptional regulator GbpR [Saezia sanguinis]|uniref:HTH-type transcriptional regulator GbpR n=1 Tax=Saezia sanguinis TaxID=1965230 RepID=A0A433SHJ0_9BURK|nr:LysR substrate-binding domain-containing protein [Saezia sanguinis]RUS68227.1 HTH-type transcriptional regulator GbpR [Saezia sanguinis]
MDWTQKLKFHHLQILVTLADQCNLTRVAELMNITQPALSKWLTGLEEEVGIPLFERHSKGIRPTPGGLLVIKHARRILNDLERSREDIELFKGGVQGSLMVGSSPVATDIVAQAMLNLMQDHPKIHLRIFESVMTPLLEHLLLGQIDVVVGRIGGNALALPLNYRVLYSEPICFVARCGHPLAAEKEVSWRQLAQWIWIVWPTGTPIRVSIDNALVANGMMMPPDHIESGSMSVSLRMLQASDMVGILSQRLAQSYAAEKQLTILNLPHIAQQGSVGVFWRQNEQPSDVLQAFLDHLISLSQQSDK